MDIINGMLDKALFALKRYYFRLIVKMTECVPVQLMVVEEAGFTGFDDYIDSELFCSVVL